MRSDSASTAPAEPIQTISEPAPDPAALIARWESLDESRRSAAVARSHARALLRLLRGLDGEEAEVACHSALGLLGRVVLLKDAADGRFADHDHATALALHVSGPVEVGAWRYRGECVGSLWVVVREPIEFAAAHACTAIESDSETA